MLSYRRSRGYVTKTIGAVELADAVERVHGGDAVFSPRLAGFVLDTFSGDVATITDPELDQLTPREQEVLRLIARGYAYKEIASRLHLSVKTIETHVSAVLRKLQLSNRHQLTAWVNERRLICATRETNPWKELQKPGAASSSRGSVAPPAVRRAVILAPEFGLGKPG
jgi:DNA-binding NarL/FixJ family response regulator